MTRRAPKNHKGSIDKPSTVDKRHVIDDAAGMLRPGRECAWCGNEIDPAARRDALTCSKRCRQAKARFRVAPAGSTASTPLRFAYADPPYPGMARKYYGTEEVDHVELIEGLLRRFPDGWALSTAASTLQEVLAICPACVRVASWVKGARQGVAYRPRSAWEPLIVYRGRARLLGVAEYSSDVLLWGGRQQSHPGALVGMKPAAFAEWMFEQLGASRGDDLTDIFPGSGAIMRAWGLFQRRDSSSDMSAPGGGDTNDTRSGGDKSVAPVPLADQAVPRGSRDGYRRDSCLAGAVRRLENAIGEGSH